MQVRASDPAKFGNCGCGRSPTGKCMGWHGLTQEEFQQRQRAWFEEEVRRDTELEEKNKDV